MSDPFRNKVWNNLNQKTTDELVEIWKTNDRVEWMDVAYEAIQEILLERLGELPSQNEPVFEHVKMKEKEVDRGVVSFIQKPGKIDEDVRRYLDEENAPVFYKPQDVLNLDQLLYYAAIAAVIITILTNLINLPYSQKFFYSFMHDSVIWSYASWLVATIYFLITTLVQCVIYFFPLKALGSILKILMQMEYNSRSTKSS